MATGVHIVQKGDTLSEIAQSYGTTVANLVKINNIADPDKIVVGQRIKLTASSGSTSSASQKAVVTAFGIQTGTERLMYATWTWSRDNTDSYSYKWIYSTGDGVGFIGGTGSVTSKQVTFTPPDNARQVSFYVKPIAKKRKVNGKETSYWTASWSSKVIYDFDLNPPKTPSNPPTVTIDKYKLTATLDNLDVNAKIIEFQIVKDDKKLFKTGQSSITTTSVSYSCTVDAGSEYKVRCRSCKDKKNSDWTDYSNNVSTIPSAPSGITSIKAASETSVYLEWASVKSATSYDIEYATKKSYFDKSDAVQSVSNIQSNKYEKTGLETGNEYFFRVRAVNEQGASAWTKIKSVRIGKPPAAPTTWSSTTTVIVGELLKLYWVHNSADGSEQKSARLYVKIGDKENTYTINTFNSEEDDENNINYYTINTSEYTEGTKIEWKVQTAGISGSSAGYTYGDWSILRTVDVYAPPVLELNVTDRKGEPIDVLTSFPLYITGETGPNTQEPIGYHLTITSNDAYETVDQIGNFKMVNAGDEVYSEYFDITDSLRVILSPDRIDLENNMDYTVVCVATMNSGLTAESSVIFTVDWVDDEYFPNAEINIDEDTLSAHIRPFCSHKPYIYYKVTHDVINNRYIATDEVIDELGGEPVYDIIKTEQRFTTDGKPVYKSVDLGEGTFHFVKTQIGLEQWLYHKVEYDSATDSYIVLPGTIDPVAGVPVYDVDVIMSGVVESEVGNNSNDEEIARQVFTDTGELIFKGFNSANEEVYFYMLPAEQFGLVDGIQLSVYRREYDGSFVEIATGIPNNGYTFVTDPHPALDYARYRVVATSNVTGAVSFYDLPGQIVGEKAVIIQWAEEWSNFDTNSEDVLENPAWSGSMLKLPYNIDVSDKNSLDVSLIEYAGRKHPVSYYGTQVGETSSWSVVIPKEDKETLYALRRLRMWLGDVYVREPSGSGYWANINVSFSQKHRDLTIPVTLEITRVEGGV